MMDAWWVDFGCYFVFDGVLWDKDTWFSKFFKKNSNTHTRLIYGLTLACTLTNPSCRLYTDMVQTWSGHIVSQIALCLEPASLSCTELNCKCREMVGSKQDTPLHGKTQGSQLGVFLVSFLALSIPLEGRRATPDGATPKSCKDRHYCIIFLYSLALPKLSENDRKGYEDTCLNFKNHTPGLEK